MFPDRLTSNPNEEKAREWIHDENTEIVCSFGFNFDYLNYRLLAIHNLMMTHRNQEFNFIANVYPYGDEGFKNRRYMANKIRNINHEAEITYYSCPDLLHYVFSRLK